MTNFIIIAVSILTGILFKKFKALPKDSHKAINTWVIYIALPAITLLNIPKMQWNPDLIFPILMPLIVFITAFLLVEIYGKFKPVSRKTKASIILTVGLSNVSFLGFPLTEAYYGAKGLQLAILCDQASFMVVSTLGILTATHASGSSSRFDFKLILYKLVTFPPTIAFIAAFVIPRFINLEKFDPVFESLGATMVPMALFSVGLQLQFKEWKADKTLLLGSLVYKLALAPMFIFLISWFFIIEKLYVQVSVLEAAMAPMVTGSIIATEFNLKPKLSTMILSFGIPFSFITTYFWFLILS